MVKKRFVKVLYLLLLFSFLFQNISISQVEYVSEVLFTIPWGDEYGSIPLAWFENDPEIERIDAPGPCSISPSGGFVVADWGSEANAGRLTKYCLDGAVTAQIILNDYNLRYPDIKEAIAVAYSGEVLISRYNKAYMLNNNLQPIHSAELPSWIISVWPSINGGFWCRYTVKSGNQCDQYLVEYNLGGTLSDPILLFSGECNDPQVINYRYFSPSGQAFSTYTDMYGYTYSDGWVEYNLYKVEKRSPTGELVYTNYFSNENGWERCSIYCLFTWDGDYYTTHGTSNGLVVTKYTYQPE